MCDNVVILYSCVTDDNIPLLSEHTVSNSVSDTTIGLNVCVLIFFFVFIHILLTTRRFVGLFLDQAALQAADV